MTELNKYYQFAFSKKRHYVFLLFVMCTSVFWFINKLSKDYSQIVTYNIEYIDLPQKFVFQENPVKSISVKLNTTGYYFFKRAFKTKKIQLSLKNVKQKSKYSYYLSNINLLRQVRLRTSDKVEVIEVLEDNLTFKLGKRSFKKVPVIPNININYHLGYNSFDGLKITPDSIKISGPELQLKKIKNIGLELFKKEDVLSSITENLKIIKPNVDKINYDTEIVRLEVDVEKITEKTLLLPIQVINTGNKEVVVYPKKIKVTCLVRLSQFNQIKENDFIVIADYNKRGAKYINTQLIKKSSSVYSIKLQKNKVEYLILK